MSKLATSSLFVRVLKESSRATMRMMMQLLVGRPAFKNAGCQVFKCSRRAISSSNLTIEHAKDPSRFENRPANKDLVFGTVSYYVCSVDCSVYCLRYGTDTPYGWDVSMILVRMIFSC